VEDDPRLSRLYNRFYLQGDRSATYAERAGDPKLARLQCIKLRSAHGKLALEIGDDLLSISCWTMGRWAHLRTSTDRLFSQIIPPPLLATTLFSIRTVRGGR
jgi:hypothetical protein